MARTPIYAAGGIVIRGRKRPRIAIVQRSKDDRWVLPRGKLKRNENPVAGARREALEETGHPVKVHEFLGAITYRTGGRAKIVEFWRMHAAERPSRDVTSDITTVAWLPLPEAVRRLSFPLEKLFLDQAGRRVLRRRGRRSARTSRPARPVKTRKSRTGEGKSRKTKSLRKSKRRAR